MDKGVLQRYSARPERDGDATVVELDPIEDLGCFGWLRGIRERAVMLELRKKSGECLAINYAFIDRIDYDPSNGIRIQAGPTTITIRGRNLNTSTSEQQRLFLGLTRHRVPWIQEVPEMQAVAAAGGDCVVDGMSW